MPSWPPCVWGCAVPIAVINVVSHNLQTYPAEVGVGAPCTSVPDGVSFCAEVVETGNPMSVADARTHPVYADNPMVRAGVIGSYAGVPLVDDGFVLGSVSIFDSRPRSFSAADLQMLELQAQLASSVLALRRSARTDVLTGLPNRAVCMDRLSLALRRLDRNRRLAAVMYLDVDNFKGFNDSLGHDAGDQVLVEIARRLSSVLRPADTLARLGGDEFVAICEDVPDAEGAERIAARMVTAAGRPWLVDGHHIEVGVSIGIVLADTSSAEPGALLRTADAAMYRAKETAGSSWALVSSADVGTGRHDT